VKVHVFGSARERQTQLDQTLGRRFFSLVHQSSILDRLDSEMFFRLAPGTI
jgi:hypothetical protein